jgi:cytochrome P450
VQTYLMWRWPFGLFERCRARNGTRFTLEVLGFPPLVFLSSKDDVKALLAASPDALCAGRGSAVIEPIVGPSAFTLQEGEEHMSGRRTVVRLLRKDRVEQHAAAVETITRRAMASWPQNTSFALHPSLRALTLEVILRKIFTFSQAACDERLQALHDVLMKMLAVADSPVFPEPSLRYGPGRLLWRRFLRWREQADELVYGLIDERKHAGTCTHEDLLSGLLGARGTAGRPLPAQQVRDEIMSLILAGHETTAAQLAWAFQLLAHDPSACDRLVQEIERGERDEYLTATVQEVQRHRPVLVFTIPRAVDKAIAIGDWTYQPPAHLLGSIYLLHHDPDVYADPFVFRPERFLEAAPQPHAWLPWGGGRRRCPGLHLATLEMRTVLRTVLSTMSVLPATRHVERARWRSVVVMPHAGCRVVLSAR